MVMVADVVPCPDVMAHPVPETVQLYEIAPSTSSIEKTLPVEETHKDAGTTIEVGDNGVAVGVSVPVVDAELVPQVPLSEITDTEPSPLPMVMVAEVVPCPAVIDQPVPVTDQVYEAAPETAAILNTFPVEPAQRFVG